MKYNVNQYEKYQVSEIEIRADQYPLTSIKMEKKMNNHKETYWETLIKGIIFGIVFGVILNFAVITWGF